MSKLSSKNMLEYHFLINREKARIG